MRSVTERNGKFQVGDRVIPSPEFLKENGMDVFHEVTSQALEPGGLVITERLDGDLFILNTKNRMSAVPHWIILLHRPGEEDAPTAPDNPFKAGFGDLVYGNPVVALGYYADGDPVYITASRLLPDGESKLCHSGALTILCALPVREEDITYADPS